MRPRLEYGKAIENFGEDFSLESSKNQDDRHCTKVCVECGSSTTSMEKTKWGIYPHWYGTIERPICKKCYVRKKWQEKYVPKGVKCDRCGKETLIVTKYGTQIWVRDKKKKNVYYCKGCFVILRDTGQIRSYEARENIGIGIHKALNKGVIFGKTKYTLDNTVFDTTTEESAYWSGFLMSDGNISYEKTGNARIALTLAKVDYSHIEKVQRFFEVHKSDKTKEEKIPRGNCKPVLLAVHFKTHCRNTNFIRDSPAKESYRQSDRIGE